MGEQPGGPGEVVGLFADQVVDRRQDPLFIDNQWPQFPDQSPAFLDRLLQQFGRRRAHARAAVFEQVSRRGQGGPVVGGKRLDGPGAQVGIVVLQGEFLEEDPRSVLAIQDGPRVTGTELRRAISHEAMKDASRPFASIMSKARLGKRRELVLDHLAAQAGYHDDEEVTRRVDKDWEEMLIETYLNEAVASRIRFKRDEFEEFYQQNLDRFRGPDEVRLEILILDTEEQAREAAAKLTEGADFDYVFRQFNPGIDYTPGKSTYIKINQLSRKFRDQLVHMKVGESSDAVQMPMGWMVFQLADRRPGTPPPLEEVEMDIRKAIYQEKFNRRLDELLAKLKAGSHIIRYEDRIEAYFNPDKED